MNEENFPSLGGQVKTLPSLTSGGLSLAAHLKQAIEREDCPKPEEPVIQQVSLPPIERKGIKLRVVEVAEFSPRPPNPISRHLETERNKRADEERKEELRQAWQASDVIEMSDFEPDVPSHQPQEPEARDGEHRQEEEENQDDYN